jgi:hypothetical protein
MTPLSPAAQAVRSAALYAGPKLEGRIAAALQAAVDQVVPEPRAFISPGTASQIRSQFLDIAAELGGGPTTPAES